MCWVVGGRSGKTASAVHERRLLASNTSSGPSEYMTLVEGSKLCIWTWLRVIYERLLWIAFVFPPQAMAV